MGVELTIYRDSGLDSFIRGWSSGVKQRQMRDAVNDIIDAIYDEVRRRAPVGETRRLRDEAIDRDRADAFGGRVLRDTYEGNVTLGPVQTGAFHSRLYPLFVHGGTGIFAGKGLIRPQQASHMVFEIDGRKFRRKTVQGQRAQPFMREALAALQTSYIPIRVRTLAVRLSA